MHQSKCDMSSGRNESFLNSLPSSLLASISKLIGGEGLGGGRYLKSSPPVRFEEEARTEGARTILLRPSVQGERSIPINSGSKPKNYNSSI
jgi:hypothetical protein